MADGNARIELTRTKKYSYSVRAFKVLVDGQPVGRIKNGATERFEVEAGEHEITVKIDFARAGLPVRVEPGQTVRLSCGVLGNLKSMVSLTGAIFLDNVSAGATIDSIPSSGEPVPSGSPAGPAIGDEPTPSPDADETTVSAGQVVGVDADPNTTISVRLDDELQLIPVHSESMRRKSRRTSTITFTRTVEHTLEMTDANSTGGEVKAGWGPISGVIRKEISRELGRTFQSSQTVSQQVEVVGSAELRWIDVWRTGVARVVSGGRTIDVPIRFRERTELEVDDELDAAG